jgi:hypothetical protein
MSERAVRMERDIWVLLQSVAPEQAAGWIADKLDAVGDPEFLAIHLDYDAAFDWSPDDPRLPDLSTAPDAGSPPRAPVRVGPPRRWTRT